MISKLKTLGDSFMEQHNNNIRRLIGHSENIVCI